MQPNHLLKLGLYTIICAATLMLWVGEDEPFPYPLLVIPAALVGFVLVDTLHVLQLSRPVMFLAGLGIIVLFCWEATQLIDVDPVGLLGHLLVYLQVALFLHRKKPGYYWFMLVMSMLQVIIAALHNHRPLFGVLLIIYIVGFIWVLSQLALLRDESSCLKLGTGQPPGAPAGTSDQPRIMFSTWESLGKSLLVSSGLLAGGMLFFMIIPRSQNFIWAGSYLKDPDMVTGFDTTIRLGQLGEILESDDEVMTVHLYDPNGSPLHARSDPLWRGVTLTYYENGRWQRHQDIFLIRISWQNDNERYIRQEIQLQPFPQDVLFGLRPVVFGAAKNGQVLELSMRDGVIVRPRRMGSGAIQYTLLSAVDPAQAQQGEVKTRTDSTILTQVPDPLRKQLLSYIATSRALNPELTEELPRIASRANVNAELKLDICTQLLGHLRDSGQFLYELQDQPAEGGIDPVLDFLINRKTGHCEYYASALALMLRSVRIPARVVNGFKGGDWNESGRFYIVRQRHAHSWVEAYTGPPGEERWITLDPTPSLGRLPVSHNVTTTESFLREIRDGFQYVWSEYVLHYNIDEQRAAVYGPIGQRISAALSSLKQTWQSGNRLGVVLVIILVCLPILLPLGSRMLRVAAQDYDRVDDQLGSDGFWARVRRAARRSLSALTRRPQSGVPRVDFYTELLAMLEGSGFIKGDSETPRQYADKVARHLSNGVGQADAASIPSRVVERYYATRYGNYSIGPEESQELHGMLGRLKEAIHGSKAVA